MHSKTRENHRFLGIRQLLQCLQQTCCFDPTISHVPWCFRPVSGWSVSTRSTASSPHFLMTGLCGCAALPDLHRAPESSAHIHLHFKMHAGPCRMWPRLNETSHPLQLCCSLVNSTTPWVEGEQCVLYRYMAGHLPTCTAARAGMALT